MNQHRIGIATGCLHFLVIVYLFGSLLLSPLLMRAMGSGPEFLTLMIALAAPILVIEAVVIGLHARKRWAWLAGIVLFALCIPSLFLRLGALGLWALLDSGSQAEFTRPRSR